MIHPVFPAPAGVILQTALNAAGYTGFPRTCGGDPIFFKKEAPL